MNPQTPYLTEDPAGHEPEAEFGRRRSGFWTSKAGLATVGFLLIAAFLLLSEHRAHALGVLPFLLLAACPLLHMFMHGGHGGHGRHTQQKEPEPGAQNGSAPGKEHDHG
mgnify:CR=1 FL=1